jgi:hypothetical protein
MDIDFNLVLLLNIRTVLSLLGISCIVWFTWQWDRKWEQVGPESKGDSTEKESSASDYKSMEGGTASAVDITLTGKTLPPYNALALVGWVLLAVSHIFSRWSWWGLDFDWENVCCTIVLGAVGYVHAVFIPTAIVERKQNTALRNGAMVAGLFLAGVLTYVENPSEPILVAPLGGRSFIFCI